MRHRLRLVKHSTVVHWCFMLHRYLALSRVGPRLILELIVGRGGVLLLLLCVTSVALL